MHTQMNPIAQLKQMLQSLEEPLPEQSLVLIANLNTKTSNNAESDYANKGIALINDFYKQFTTAIYSELSSLFQGARLLTKKLYSGEKLSPDERKHFHDNLVIIYREIKEKTNVLKNIKDLLKKPELPTRFNHLNAHDLTVLANVIAFVLEDFKQKKVAAEQIFNLEQLAAAISENMRLRLSTENSDSLNLSVFDNALAKSWQRETTILNPLTLQLDHSYQAMAMNPFSEQQATAVPDYFKAFIERYSGEKKSEAVDPITAPAYIAFANNTTALVYDYFKPDNNPYVGLAVDASTSMYAVGLSWCRYAKDACQATVDLSSFLVNSLRNNPVAQKVNQVRENLHVQKIEASWSERWENLCKFLDRGYQVVREKFVGTQQQTETSSTESGTSDTAINAQMSEIERLLQDINSTHFAELDAFNKKQSQACENALQGITDNWVMLKDSELTQSQVPSSESNTTTDSTVDIEDPTPVDEITEHSAELAPKIEVAKLLALMEIMENTCTDLNTYIEFREERLRSPLTLYRKAQPPDLQLAKRAIDDYVDLVSNLDAALNSYKEESATQLSLIADLKKTFTWLQPLQAEVLQKITSLAEFNDWLLKLYRNNLEELQDSVKIQASKPEFKPIPEIFEPITEIFETAETFLKNYKSDTTMGCDKFSLHKSYTRS